MLRSAIRSTRFERRPSKARFLIILALVCASLDRGPRVQQVSIMRCTDVCARGSRLRPVHQNRQRQRYTGRTAPSRADTGVEAPEPRPKLVLRFPLGMSKSTSLTTRSPSASRGHKMRARSHPARVWKVSVGCGVPSLFGCFKPAQETARPARHSLGGQG